MQFYIISHFFFGKVNLDIKMGLSWHENKSHRISKMSVLPSLRTKLLLYVRHETPSKLYISGDNINCFFRFNDDFTSFGQFS